ncbi:MAG: cobalamin-dependent protein [Spirochaetales bacterium]|nr:cobalamin-dependent protein [Spirochaetales bacterium]
MSELIDKISICVERGKVNLKAPFPPDLKEQPGADEYTREALEKGETPEAILQACNQAMENIGGKFSRNEVFVPELLMAAKAMNVVMEHLKPYFKSGNIKSKGVLVLGTVAGDLHDIGKNLVSMVIEGNGWKVEDLGSDVKTEKFLKAIENCPGCIVGLSALLTTTMGNMAKTVVEIKKQYPDIKIIVGGAPLSARAAEEMGADAYAADPQEAVKYLNSWAS